MARFIGKAAIKVYPDTKGFRRQTEKELKRELKDFDRELAKDPDGRVKIPVTVDVDQKASARNVQAFLKKLDGLTTTVKIDFDISDKLQHLEESLDGFARKGRTVRFDIEADLQADQFEKDFRRMLRDTDHMSKKASDLIGDIGQAFTWIGDDAEDAGRRASRVFDDLERDWMESFSGKDKFRYAFSNLVRESKHNFDEVKRGWREVLESIRNSNTTSNVDIEFDLSTLEGNLQRIRHGLQEIKDDFDDTNLDFHPVIDRTSWAMARGTLMRLSRDRLVMLYPLVSKTAATVARRTLRGIYNASGLKSGVQMMKDFAEYLENIHKNAPALAVYSSAIAGIGGAAIGALGSVSHLAMELVRMSGAALALPGIAGGFAVGIGVMITAFRAWDKHMKPINDSLSELGGMIQDRFWQQARVPMLEAWNRVLPSLQRGFDKTAVSLGKWTAAMATGFSQNLRPESMNYMFDNLSESIDVASESADDLGRIIEVLGKRGSEYLPRLAQWANGLASGFRDWLDEADRTGLLNEIIETGIQKMREFGKLVGESGRLIYILGSAAERAGFSGLREMADGMEELNDSLVENQDRLDDYMRGAARMADGAKAAIGSVVSGLGEFSSTFDTISVNIENTLTNLGGLIGDILSDENFQDGVIGLFEGLDSAVSSLSEKAPEIAALLGAVGEVAGVVLENIGAIAAQLIDTFGPSLTQLLTEVKGPLDNLGHSISNLLAAMGDKDGNGSSFLGTLTSLASPALAAGIDQAARAIGSLADLIDGVFSGGGWSSIGSALKGIGRILLANITFGMSELIFKLGPMFAGWADEIRAMWDAFVSVLTSIFSWFGTGGSGDPGEFDGGGPGMRSFTVPIQVKPMLALASVPDVSAFATAAVATAAAAGGGGGGGAGGGPVAAFASAVEGLKAGLQAVWDGFLGWLKGLFGFGDAGAGFSVVVDFLLNAKDKATEVIGAVWQKAKEWAKDKYEAALQALNRTGEGIRAAAGAIGNWMRTKWQALLQALDRTAPGIGAALRQIGNRIVNAKHMAKVTMSQVVTGLSSVVSKIRGAIGNFTASVKTRFTGSANGDIFNGAGVRQFANGGFENHVAQIAAPHFRLWAEPETGGEAYIPLAQSKRARSTAILAEVADRFGYGLRSYADGSEVGSSPSRSARSSGGDITLNVQTLHPDIASEFADDVMFQLRHIRNGGGFGVAA